MIHRLRDLSKRRRLARLIARAHGLRNSLKREWRWACRDLSDLKAELHALLHPPSPERRPPPPPTPGAKAIAHRTPLREELAALDRQLAGHERREASHG